MDTARQAVAGARNILMICPPLIVRLIGDVEEEQDPCDEHDGDQQGVEHRQTESLLHLLPGPEGQYAQGNAEKRGRKYIAHYLFHLLIAAAVSRTLQAVTAKVMTVETTQIRRSGTTLSASRSR